MCRTGFSSATLQSARCHRPFPHSSSLAIYNDLCPTLRTIRPKSSRAARLLRAGRLVAFPTETVYGLGANALDAEAVARIYAVKRRPPTSPLIVHVASIEMAKSLVATWPEIADRLAQKFWPGPLTMVLPSPRSGGSFVRHAEPSTAAFHRPYPRQSLLPAFPPSACACPLTQLRSL